jgi:hypothetical protein
MTNSSHDYARETARAILAGDLSEAPDIDQCGDYRATLEALADAHEKAGTEGARAAWTAMVNQTPDLARWLATDEPDEPERRYTLHTAAEALEPQPDTLWLIDGLFSEGSVNLLVGDPGTAKTYSLLDAAVCVAMGLPWLTFATTQTAALVIDEESGPRRIARRLGDCLRGHDGDAETPIYYTTLDRFDLRSGDDIAALRAAIGETDARFVVIDALVDIMPGGDENAVADVQPVFIALRDLADEAGAAIVLIHHNNKAGGYRGSSAMHGAVDTLIGVKKDGDEIALDTLKRRDGEPFKFAAVGYWEPGRFWMVQTEVTESPTVLSKSEQYVIRYLTERGASELTEITAHADICSGGSARNAVYALTNKGFTERCDAGGQGTKATYDLTETGKTYA